MEAIESLDSSANEFQGLYQNKMQLEIAVVDANTTIAEIARAGGKTEGITGPRMVKVQNAMPGELSFLIHSTFVALMTNITPALRSYFSQTLADGKSMMEYGIDFVMGERKLPSHFRQPRYPIDNPKYTIVFRNGHQVQLVSSDQPESMAGRSGVHAFIEEMKHNKGEKVKTRIFPGLRGADFKARQCHYYQGITGVSDTARVDLGEDNWFEDYEKNQNRELIDEIATTFNKVNSHMYQKYKLEFSLSSETNPYNQELIRKEIARHQRIISNWQPTLADMRRVGTHYVRASSFVNKDFLGVKFFKTMIETLTEEEFLVSIGAVRLRKVVNMFFSRFDKSKHTFSDSYNYNSILKFSLSDSFKLTAFYLKYFKKKEPLILGYDPGGFSSLVVAQESIENNRLRLRVLKDFTSFDPNPQADIAKQFYSFFGEDMDRKFDVILYYDRAGNKSKEEYEQITSDVALLEREFASYGIHLQLMNKDQRTIYHYEHYKLLEMIFSNQYNSFPEVLIDENECKNLVSSIYLSPKKENEKGRIILDKSSERKVAKKFQAALTTQLSSAFMYLLFGKYHHLLPSEISSIPDLPDNVMV